MQHACELRNQRKLKINNIYNLQSKLLVYNKQNLWEVYEDTNCINAVEFVCCI
jgi:hypothetical protein